MSSRNPANGHTSQRSRKAAATRTQILETALTVFARSGYDGVGMREIGAAAGVDPRLVGHYFGSKEQLFAEVVESTMGAQLPEPPGIAQDRAASLLLQSIEGTPRAGFLLTIRSTSNPRAVEILRSTIERGIENPLAEQLSGEHAEGRAALLLAMNLGVLIMREVLGSAALTAENSRELVPYLEAAFRAIASPAQDEKAGGPSEPEQGVGEHT
jgi:AcrR family transcriptional regulator